MSPAAAVNLTGICWVGYLLLQDGLLHGIGRPLGSLGL